MGSCLKGPARLDAAARLRSCSSWGELHPRVFLLHLSVCFFLVAGWCLAASPVKPCLSWDPSWLFPCSVCILGMFVKACRDRRRDTVGCLSGGIFFLLGLVEPMLIDFQSMLRAYYTQPHLRGNTWLFMLSWELFWILLIWYLLIYT